MMNFSGFEKEDFNIKTGLQNKKVLQKVLQKLESLGSDIIERCKNDPKNNNLKGFYVGKKNDFKNQWVGFYPFPIGKNYDDNFLAEFPHIHYVLSQGGEDTWVGVNIEFATPREILINKLSSKPSEAIYSIKKAHNSKIGLYCKSVLREDHRVYRWDGRELLDKDFPQVAAENLTDGHVNSIVKRLKCPMKTHSEPGIWVWEPIFLLHYDIPSHIVVELGSCFLEKLYGKIANLNNFLRFLCENEK